jgi:hypothetical protein
MNTYKTNDINLASYLRAKNFRLVGTSRDIGRVTFNFPDSQEIQSAINDYWNNANVPVSSFVKANSDLKTLIFS